MLEIALIVVCIAIPFFCLFSFREGLRVGQGREKSLNPITAMKEHKETAERQVEAQKKAEELDIVNRNLRNYTGDATGQIKIGASK